MKGIEVLNFIIFSILFTSETQLIYVAFFVLLMKFASY